MHARAFNLTGAFDKVQLAVPVSAYPKGSCSLKPIVIHSRTSRVFSSFVTQ